MIIDTAENTTSKLAQLKAQGCTAIIRYDDRIASGDWKQIKPAEAKAIKDAGLLLGIVYEHTATPSGEVNGVTDAEYSVRMAPLRGQPKGSAVYFAVDYDASSSDVKNKIIPYFKGVKRVMDAAGFRVGVYGSGFTCQSLKTADLVELTWITCSRGFAGSAAYVAAGLQDLWQTQCEKTLLGLDVDFNEAKNPDWGAFVPWGAVTQTGPWPPTSPAAPVHDEKWIQSSLNKLGYGAGAVDGKIGPTTMEAVKLLIEVTLKQKGL